MSTKQMKMESVLVQNLDLNHWHHVIDSVYEQIKKAVVARTVTIVIAAVDSADKTGHCMIENDDDQDFKLAVGDSVCFCNKMEKDVKITFQPPFIFGLTEAVIVKGACPSFDVVDGTVGQENPYVLGCEGNGGGPKFIVVQPPSANA